MREKSAADRVVQSMRVNAAMPARYDRRSKNEQAFFFLKARNGQDLGISEMFATADAREAAITLVRQAATAAVVEERV